MLPVVKGAKETRKQILLYSLVLIPVCLAPVFTGLGGPTYLAVSALGGLGSCSWPGACSKARPATRPTIAATTASTTSRTRRPPRGSRAKDARNLFAFSILYLFAMFATLLGEAAAGVARPGAAQARIKVFG
jgi:protoheme IX farnesyltransferase